MKNLASGNKTSEECYGIILIQIAQFPRFGLGVGESFSPAVSYILWITNISWEYEDKFFFEIRNLKLR